MNTQTRTDRVLNWLKRHRGITSWEAFQELGITRLSAAIFELRKSGYRILDEWETITNRYGEEVKFKRYFLIKSNKPFKKLISAIAIATTLATPAMAVDRYGRPTQAQINYDMGYRIGYNNGKSDSYDNIGKTIMIAGIVVVAGIIIYELGKESRFGVSENGLTYKF